MESIQNNIHSNGDSKPIVTAKDFKVQYAQPTSNNSKEFNVVHYARFYEERKKLKLKQEEKRLQEQRRFISKPAPNFHAIHVAQQQKRLQQEPKFTIPTTPGVVHHHRERMEQIRKRVSFSIDSKLKFPQNKSKNKIILTARRNHRRTKTETI